MEEDPIKGRQTKQWKMTQSTNHDLINGRQLDQKKTTQSTEDDLTFKARWTTLTCESWSTVRHIGAANTEQ